MLRMIYLPPYTKKPSAATKDTTAKKNFRKKNKNNNIMNYDKPS